MAAREITGVEKTHNAETLSARDARQSKSDHREWRVTRWGQSHLLYAPEISGDQAPRDTEPRALRRCRGCC
eukprot:11685386-Alexandrium_andersonii.AAC.1